MEKKNKKGSKRTSKLKIKKQTCKKDEILDVSGEDASNSNKSKAEAGATSSSNGGDSNVAA